METKYLTTLPQELTDTQKSTVLNTLGVELPETVHDANVELSFGESERYIGTVGNLNVSMQFVRANYDVEDGTSRVGVLYLSTVSGTMDAIIDYKNYKLNAVSGYTALTNDVLGKSISTSESKLNEVEVCSCLTREGDQVQAQGGIAEINICDGTDVYHIYIKASPVDPRAASGTFDVTITK